MTERSGDALRPRPPATPPAAAMPWESHEGVTPLAVTGDIAARSLVTAPLNRVLLRFALPAVASTLLMTLFFWVDAYWVGTRVGSEGLAAVSTSLFWIWMIVSLAEMISIGLTAVAARRFGEGRSDEAARITWESILLALVLGIVVAVTGHHFLGAIFAVMHTPPAVTELGIKYLGVYLLGAPLIYGFFAVDAAFRAAGDTRTPFVLLAASVAVTLALDPILILGLFGAPRLGITGAAIANVCTRSAAFLLGIIVLWQRGWIRVTMPRLSSLATVCRVGLPTATTGIAFSIIYVALTRTTTQFGTPALAAIGIGHRVESWLFMVGVGFGAAAAAIVGQNLGAGQPQRAMRAGWLAVGYASIAGVVVCALALLIPEQLASFFTNDPAVIRESARYLRIAALADLFTSAELVLEAAMGGAGATVAPMIASTGLTALRVPLAVFAAARWGTSGIWWVISLTAAARGIAMLILWRRAKWMRTSI